MAINWGGAAGGAASGAAAGTMVNPGWGTVIGAGIGGLAGAFSGKKKKGDNKGLEWIKKPPYTGQRPYSGAEVGMGSEQLKPLSEQFIRQILERSKGEGQVGFDPKWYETRKKQGLGDLAEQYREGRDIRSGQSSGQGLRGGIPVSIEQKSQEDYGDTTADFLDRLSIADLEARREDINKATYAQPDTVQLGAGIQQNRAAFDLNEYNATMPLLYEYPQEENVGSGMFDIFGNLLGGKQGGNQQTLAQALAMLNSSSNKSMVPQKTLSDYRAEARRY